MPTYKAWRFECKACGAVVAPLQWDSDPAPVCGGCQQPMTLEQPPMRAASVIGDDIPGGMTLEHVALRNGEPQRFYSKRAATDAAMRAGWTRFGDTPKEKRHREV